jgi:hypothetical protein
MNCQEFVKPEPQRFDVFTDHADSVLGRFVKPLFRKGLAD